ncbi:haloacid dehalogenase [Lophiotrema nucula]|uniref:Haloacid dehalogenase n=1 Tax=Lophiotrema nucula TaxID=690887 RepID=A0A6A5YZY3_9PLEO|nr:haloacid dehalogenase [Lophiotrema nucula]
MAKLTAFKLLSFDVYGTLIDMQAGIESAFQPTLSKSNLDGKIDRKTIMSAVSAASTPLQEQEPGLKYSALLTKAHPEVAKKLGCTHDISEEESRAFGASVGSWPAFPDTVDALQRLQKFYKLVVLSNVDNDSFAACNAGPLEGFEFDAILTAQDIGSYKPDPRNFEYMFKVAKEKFGVEREEVLQTAQSQLHDHQPAKKHFGMKTSWIARYGVVLGGSGEEPVWDWKFATLGEMADAVEKEAAEK